MQCGHFGVAFIFALIMISGVYAFVKHMKRYKEEEQSLPP
jgi:hypothetical protein